MAFNQINLSVLAYANNFTIWHYTSADQEILTDNYFSKAADMMCANDLIFATFDTDGEVKNKFLIVKESANLRDGNILIATMS